MRYLQVQLVAALATMAAAHVVGKYQQQPVSLINLVSYPILSGTLIFVFTHQTFVSLVDGTTPVLHPEGKPCLDDPSCHWVGTAPLCEG